MIKLVHILTACAVLATVLAADEAQEQYTNDAIPSNDELGNSDDSNGARQKRWYNFPPYTSFTSVNRRITPLSQQDDTLLEIFRRVKDISSYVRQPQQPLLPPHLPIFFPVIFIPQGPCQCHNSNNSPKDPTIPTNNSNVPDLSNRVPEMEDERQNWGIVRNDSQDEFVNYNRPVSFEPIPPNSELPPRPLPPVEHGSIQADMNAPTPSPFGNIPVTQNPTNPATQVSSSEAPNSCDFAVLICCHQIPTTEECFRSNDCANFSSLGENPCSPVVAQSVVEKFKRIYSGRRTG